MPNKNTRPEYYKLCVTYGMLVGIRIVDRQVDEYEIAMRLVHVDGTPMYPFRSYAVGESGSGEIHRGHRDDPKCLGRAYESALGRSGYVVRKGGLQRCDARGRLVRK